jgi:hypothetical protein
LLCLAVGDAWAAAAGRSYDDADFGIDLPEGYLDPVEHVDGPSVSRGFRKPFAGTPLSTVILVTVHNHGPSFAKRVQSERGVVTRETLDTILTTIAQNRGGFRKGEPRNVTLAGYNGLAVAWNGSAQGYTFDGVVYCVLVGPRAYAVQIQSPAGRGSERLGEAVRAVERMRIARAGEVGRSAPLPSK